MKCESNVTFFVHSSEHGVMLVTKEPLTFYFVHSQQQAHRIVKENPLIEEMVDEGKRAIETLPTESRKPCAIVDGINGELLYEVLTSEEDETHHSLAKPSLFMFRDTRTPYRAPRKPHILSMEVDEDGSGIVTILFSRKDTRTYLRDREWIPQKLREKHLGMIESSSLPETSRWEKVIYSGVFVQGFAAKILKVAAGIPVGGVLDQFLAEPAVPR